MWKTLIDDDLKIVLSEDELDKIRNVSVQAPDIIKQTLETVSEFIRGCLAAKGYKLSTEKYSIPISYELPGLIFARQKLWTRFPNSMDIALDEVRRKEEEWAEKCIMEAMIDVSPIDWKDDPDNPDSEGYNPKPLQGSIKVPMMRFVQWPFGNEFNQEINKKD